MPRNYFTDLETESIHAARTYILRHLHKPLHPRAVAREVGLSQGRLNEGFRHYFERSLAAFILETRLQTARFLLTHTRKSIKEISLLTGYRHQQNFQNAFRRNYGKTPGAFRNEHT